MILSSWIKDCAETIAHSEAGFDFIEIPVNRAEVLSASEIAFLDQLETQKDGTELLPAVRLAPFAIKKWLPNLIKLELVAGDSGEFEDVRFRLIGEEAKTWYGNVTGKLLSELSDTMAAARGYAGIVEVMESRQIVFGASRRVRMDLPYYPFRCLFVPLGCADGVEISQILVLVTVGEKQAAEAASD